MPNPPLLLADIYFRGRPAQLVGSRSGDVLVIRGGAVQWSAYVTPNHVRGQFRAALAEMRTTGGLGGGALPSPGMFPELDAAGEAALTALTDLGFGLAELPR